ncbi:MAG: DUF3568 family protein [Planctomycetes bacterium]|nr:DUF3568 family protein [Planctomycetota bacterium]
MTQARNASSGRSESGLAGRWSRFPALGALALGITLLGGCQVATQLQGKAAEVAANYKAGTLTATINAEPSQVLAAAEQTLRDRGYSIDEKGATEQQGGLFARPPAFNLGRTIRVNVVTTVDNATNIAITTNPWDESLARITLDGILQRLGL